MNRPDVGKWLSWAGAALFVFLVMTAVFSHDPGYSPDRARRNKCTTQLHQIGLALQVYAEDHARHLPPAAAWCESIRKYLGFEGSAPTQDIRVLTCPALPARSGGYAFNAALSGSKMVKWDRSRLVVCFESLPGWNVCGGKGIILRKPRHPGGTLFLFEDGHVDWTERLGPGGLVWNPSR